MTLVASCAEQHPVKSLVAAVSASLELSKSFCKRLRFFQKKFEFFGHFQGRRHASQESCSCATGHGDLKIHILFHQAVQYLGGLLIQVVGFVVGLNILPVCGIEATLAIVEQSVKLTHVPLHGFLTDSPRYIHGYYNNETPSCSTWNVFLWTEPHPYHTTKMTFRTRK